MEIYSTVGLATDDCTYNTVHVLYMLDK